MQTIYAEIKAKLVGTDLPAGGVNNDGESIVVEEGRDDAGEFVRVSTLQNNDWLRVNTYYANGDVTETYKK